jgi:hypothetical protein
MRPDSLDGRALRQDNTGVGPDTLETVAKRETLEGVKRADRAGARSSSGIKAAPEALPRISDTQEMIPPTTDEYAAASTRRAPDSRSAMDSAGASTMAVIRRQLANLQMQLADTQAELAREQQGRAEDAEEMARVLERLARAESEVDSARDDVERERAFVEELRVSVREKYEDCNTLKQKLADAETLVANQLDEAAERQKLAARAELAERELADVKKQLEVARASEQAARAEIATAGSQLEILRRAFEQQEAELTKANAGLKAANIKAFTANKQLESWRAESQRTLEQTRIEQEAAIAKMLAEHAKTLEDVRSEASLAKSVAQSAEKQIQAAHEKLALVTSSMEALDEAERQMQALREKAHSARRTALEHATHARKSLGTMAASAISPAATDRRGPVSISIPSNMPSGAAQAASANANAPAPVIAPSVATHANADAKAAKPAATSSAASPLTTRPSTTPGLAAVANSPADKKSDAPVIEFGEIEMGADELVEDLIEARNRSVH